MPGPPHLAPRGPVQARRRQLIVGVLALTLVVAVCLGLKGARGAQVDEAAPSTSVPVTPPTQLPTATPSPTTRTLPSYRTTGRYTRVATGTPVRGRSGQLMTYRVEVEQGSGVSAKAFAAFVDETLRHQRGWTAGGHWQFKRVYRAQPDLTIRLATPTSVDTACAAAGANTDGYTSCRAGNLIMLNLDRWYVGVPHVKDLTTYRHYLINHEVGHGLGLGHQRCPAKGRLAPVMVQQTLDLDGCRANAWPRTGDGREISGPPAQ